MFKTIKRYCPLPAAACIVIAAAAGICHAAICGSVRFADGFNGSAGYAVRAVLAKLSGIFPFSVAEILVFLIPVSLIAALAVFLFSKNKSTEKAVRCICVLLAVLSLFYTLFVAALLPGYHGTPIAESLGLKDAPCSAESLYRTAIAIGERISPLLERVNFTEGGGSTMDCTFTELGGKLNVAYEKAAEKYGFIKHFSSRPKPVLLSEPMTYTHISGIYSYYTGEANINVNFPDYTVVYTAAHEMAHQRGISKEDEANFIAFLVCSDSDDAYLAYSGYISLYEYVIAALYKADRDLYFTAIEKADKAVIGEMRSYNVFFEKYKDNTASEISSAVNDSYLRSQGVAAGERSYGLVADLAVAFFSDEERPG